MNVPSLVTEYLEAERAGDAKRLSLCFAEDGVVHDEGRELRGREAIQRWKEDADAKYRYISEPLEAVVDTDSVSLRAKVTGDFPGSPVEVAQTFTIAGGQIVLLEIH